MKSATPTRTRRRVKLGTVLRIEQLKALTAELQNLRSNPPLVRRAKGKYEGSILGFVRGLRLSARLIYFLRERLSSTSLEVNWGHLLDQSEDSCSPECDVIVHTPGHLREWNGSNDPIMNFKFVEAGSVRAIVSCKSTINAIDRHYPKMLKKHGVKHIFLFAECCRESRFQHLNSAAKAAGYRGLWCLYLTRKDGSFTTDESMYADFGEEVLATVKS